MPPGGSPASDKAPCPVRAGGLFFDGRGTWRGAAGAGERAYQFLLDERGRKLRAIELLSSGMIGTVGRVNGGEPIDTSHRSIMIHEVHIAELERILRDAGVPLDA